MVKIEVSKEVVEQITRDQLYLEREFGEAVTVNDVLEYWVGILIEAGE